MPPRVFMPIRHRRRPSEVRPIDPLVKNMTRGSLLIGLGFLIILAGVLVSIFAMRPKTTTRYRRPMRTYAPGPTLRPQRTREKPTEKEADEDGLNISFIIGPALAIMGVSVSLAGAIFYAVSYQRKKQKDKELNRVSTVDDEAGGLPPVENSPMESSPSAVNLTCPDVTTSVSDIQLNTTTTLTCSEQSL